MVTADRIDERVARPVAVALLMISFTMPFFFSLGGLKLTGYRVVLIIFLVPAMIRWLNGSAGKIRGVDWLIIGFAFWSALTLAVNHGLVSKWQFTGMLVIEILAPYFIARAYIRDLESFRYFVRWFLIIIVVLLPFSVYEMITEQSPLLDFFGGFANVYQKWIYEQRLGLFRAQATMPHPILFGVFMTPSFALFWYVLGWNKTLFTKVGLSSLAGIVVFTSLSSGAFLNVIIQMALMAWNKMCSFLKNKWKVLLICFAIFYVVIEVGSNRNVFQIIATHMTLTPGTAWWRILTFEFARDDIMRNPIFGIGMNDWTRPHWMTLSSVDNFWLLMTLRHGFPGLFLLLGTVLTMFIQIGRRSLTGAVADARLGYLFALCAFCVSAVTVHLWDATFCFFMFLFGAGVWFLDAEGDQGTDSEAQKKQTKRTIRYTRFPSEMTGVEAPTAPRVSAGHNPPSPHHAQRPAQPAPR